MCGCTPNPYGLAGPLRRKAFARLDMGCMIAMHPTGHWQSWQGSWQYWQSCANTVCLLTIHSQSTVEDRRAGSWQLMKQRSQNTLGVPRQQWVNAKPRKHSHSHVHKSCRTVQFHDEDLSGNIRCRSDCVEGTPVITQYEHSSWTI